jgi:S-formylglutathione hydrolase FrmB
MVEKTIPEKITSRSVVGISMNGFSVFQLWFKNPELFKKYAALCPAVTEPKVRDTGMFERLFETLAGISPFDSPEDKASIWAKHDPMALAENASALTRSLPLFLNYNEYDEFVFNSGAKSF